MSDNHSTPENEQFVPELEHNTSEQDRAPCYQDPVGAVAEYVRSPDFLELIGCLLFSAIMSVVPYLSTEITKRPVPFQQVDGDVILDLRLNNELVDETVSGIVLVLVSIVFPLLIQCFISGTLGSRRDTHRSICVYAISLGLTCFVTGFIKRYCGYLRPHFYDKCDLNYDSFECSNDGSNAEERKSFVSGHASLSFCGLTVLSHYLIRLFGVSSNVSPVTVNDMGDGEHVFVQYKIHKIPRVKRVLSIVCLSPMMVAVFISCSRVKDNFHHPADVVGGAILGVAIAQFSNGLWYVCQV